MRLVTIGILFQFFPVIAFNQNLIKVYPTVSRFEFTGMCLHHDKLSDRPKIGLVLSGGGARGIAQIGVLQVLEKYNIPIDVIVGNSLGSVIGGLYSAGYSIAQLESIITHTDWDELLSFSEETKRTELFVDQKEKQQEEFLEIRFDGLQPIIPSSMSGGQRLSNYFTYLCLQAPYHPAPSFDDLKIPFRAVATDLLSGKRILLDRGSLAEAMRASISVPLLYSPLEIDSMSLVDGGLLSNIPVDIARSLGCEKIILVNSTSSLRKAGQMKAPWEVADQIMTIMMQEPNRIQAKNADIVIVPEAGDRLVSDFRNIDTLILAGRQATEKKIDEIISKTNFSGKDTSKILQDKFPAAKLSFMGDTIAGDITAALLKEAENQYISIARLETMLNRVYSSGQYADVHAEIDSSVNPVQITCYATLNPELIQVNIYGNRVVPEQEIRKELSAISGKRLDYFEVQKALESIIKIYRNKGYSLARIESTGVLNDTLSFTINEGMIEEIHFQGNRITKDYIIRREFPLNEGDVFSIDKAYKGIVNIKSTGLFDYVLLDVRYRENKPNIFLKVSEKSSQMVGLGLYADNERALIGSVNIRDANFRGAWEEFGVVMKYGPKDRTLRTEYTVNRIFHTYFTSGLKMYYNSRDVISYSSDNSLAPARWDRIESSRYRESKYGGTLSFGSHFARLGDVTADFRIENHNVKGITGLPYPTENYRFVGLKLQSIIDSEDKFYFPTKGIYFLFSYESAMRSLGSEKQFGKISLKYESYISIFGHHTICPKITFGFADKTLPIAEQFSLGGLHSLFGLHDDDSRGRQLFLINMEYRFKLPFKIIFDTYVNMRYDLGTISAVPDELKLINFQHGIGSEISIDSPLGPASFAVGKSFHFIKKLPGTPVGIGPLLFYFSLGHNL